MIKGPRGTNDVLPSDSYKWIYLEKKFREICNRFGYKEIRTPIFEHTELFERGVGETTDVVQKEMYTFFDKGDRSITLKPEGTSPVVRSYVENKLYAEAQPIKTFYITPCFRYERPQAGRLREFHQFGIEAFGSDDPTIDVEVMALVDIFLKDLGLEDIELRINSIGCPKCRKEYHSKLKDFLNERLEGLCSTCNSRFDTNPMRIIDCKNEDCQRQIEGLPMMIDNLCDECEENFKSVKENLDILGIDYIVDPRIVRGLDYYSKTAFEFISRDIGSQATVSGGGRYNGLVESLGGKSTPAVGFGMGIERLIMTLENSNIIIPNENTIDIFIATMGEDSKKLAFKLVNDLRKEGIACEKDYLNRSLRAQFKYANKINTKFVGTIGDDEVSTGTIQIKNMETGEEKSINIDDLKKTILEEV
ncbi:MAG: histidine--tRNA ligase [Andreesenia angusta]|nr:histidine--tRNA ligase [Andreesenia angusta]